MSQGFLPLEVISNSKTQEQPERKNSNLLNHERRSHLKGRFLVKYSRGGVHGESPFESFDHNFDALKMLPKHLPPIGEPMQTPATQSQIIQKHFQLPSVSGISETLPELPVAETTSPPQIKSIVISDSPAIERQTKFRNRVLSTNMVEPLDLKKAQSLRAPHLVKVRESEIGSETPSPTSSPSNDDDPSFTISQISSLPKKRIMKPVEGWNIRKSSSMASLISSKESDGEEVSNISSSKQSNKFLPIDEVLTAPGVPRTMLSVPRGIQDVSIPKSRSLVCLAVATMAQMAGHPLNVADARSRSFLVGSVGHTSMLGPDELEKYFPRSRIRIFVGSWNMNGQSPSGHLADFLLPQDVEFVPDILAIGTQECMGESREWEVRLQDTLGPTHVLYHSHSLGTLHLAIFLRRDLIWFCSIPEVDSFSTRPGANFKTKGAVAIAFLLFGTSFLFVNSHLTAHQENVRDRVKDLMKINAMINLPKNLPIRKKHRNFADNFDCAIWCGDLNFRIEQTREVVIREDVSTILEFDQLNFLRNEGLIFNGYVEDTITFLPTYKYDPGTNNYDTSSKQRVPSYTDRILYKNHKSTPMIPLHYSSVSGVLTSDHKPVWGMWETTIKPGKDNIPLSGGLFNREVYLEGLKRRSEALKPLSKGKMNHLCSLQ